jgi:hypothetical protein
MKKFTFVVFGSVLLFASSLASANPSTVALTGTVSDASGKPLRGALVLVVSGGDTRRGVTDAAGWFSVPNLQSSVRYELEVRTLDRLSRALSVDLPAPGQHLDIVVERSASTGHRDDPGMTFNQQTHNNTNLFGGVASFGPIKIPVAGIKYERTTTNSYQTPGGSVLITTNTYQTRP